MERSNSMFKKYIFKIFIEKAIIKHLIILKNKTKKKHKNKYIVTGLRTVLR